MKPSKMEWSEGNGRGEEEEDRCKGRERGRQKEKGLREGSDGKGGREMEEAEGMGRKERDILNGDNIKEGEV